MPLYVIESIELMQYKISTDSLVIYKSKIFFPYQHVDYGQDIILTFKSLSLIKLLLAYIIFLLYT